MSDIVDAYRSAAAYLFDASDAEARVYIKTPEEDTGGWAPDARVVIYLEPDFRQEGDEGRIPGALGYWGEDGFANCQLLSETVGDGSYIEYINAAVAAVW